MIMLRIWTESYGLRLEGTGALLLLACYDRARLAVAALWP